jgi:prepilin-type N-terminal cleavage/methylation domain-containing protein
MHSFRVLHARRAFTLIELLMVMVVASAMMAIAVPRFRLTDKAKARMAARQMLRDLEHARNKSLSQKKKVQVAFNTVTNSYTAYLDNNGDGVIVGDAAERTALNAFGTRRLGTGVVFGRGDATAGVPGEVGVGGVTFAGAISEFDSRGIPTPIGSVGTVYITTTSDPTAVYAVSMSAAGSYRLWQYASSGVWQ